MQPTSPVKVAVAILAAFLLTSALGVAGATAHPFGKKGRVYACYKVKGKNRGALRVVRHPRKCKKMRGWRRMSWSALGFPGPAGAPGGNGAAGATGQAGERGPQGDSGAQGSAGEVEKTLIETVQTQSVKIDELSAEVTGLTSEVGSLTSQVVGLSNELVNLEGTVEGACTQLTEVTAQSDELTEAVAGLSLNSTLEALGGLLEIPPLPPLQGTFECS